MFGTTDNSTLIGDGGGTETRIALYPGVDTHYPFYSDSVPRLFASFAQHALLNSFFVTDDATRNGVTQTIRAVYEEKLAVSLDNDTGTQDGRDLPQREKSNGSKYDACHYTFNLLFH